MHRFTTSLHTYCLLGKANVFPELEGCRHPGCCYEGRLRKHGFYSRWAITLDGLYLVWIQRYLCPACGHTTSLLPTFLAPHCQFALGVLVWILEGLHQLQLSACGLVRHWQKLRPGVELSRQSIQHMRRRLRRHSRLCVQLLGADEGDVARVEQVLLKHLPRFNGIEGFAHAFFEKWRQPFLSRV